jgi:hypothetical protein
MAEDPTLAPLTGAIIAGAAAYAFLVSPVLRYADVDILAWTAPILGLGTAATWVAAHLRPPRIVFNLISGVAFASLTVLSLTVLDARKSASANDRRCLAIQRDMLSAHPRKPDGPALFQAFGCRPQGEGSVMVPPSTTGLAAAKRGHR